MRRPEAILFDLDDTLTNRHAMFETFSAMFVNDHFGAETPARRREILTALRHMDDNGNARRPALFYRLYGYAGCPMPPEQELLDYWNTVFPRCMVPMEGMAVLLERLRALPVRLGMITNGSPALQNNKIDTAGIRGYFDMILVSGDFPFEKPDRRIFELALSRLGVPAGASLFVGDNLINDIYGAQQAGLHDLWINAFDIENNKGVTPSAEIRSLDELLRMAEQWV